MRKTKIPEWYRIRYYPHFDLPLSFKQAKNLVLNSVEKHSFLPFLSFEIKTRRYHRDPKIRRISYASHRDGYIFSYYAHLLNEKYELLLKKEGLSQNVLAYRSRIGDNIDFAKEAFDNIVKLADCVAIGFDIESFFDSLDHRILKQRWNHLLGTSRLPADYFAIFKALTKYAFIDRDACYKRLGYSRRKARECRPICTPSEFRSVIRGRKGSSGGLIKVNETGRGIPQGTSISSISANVYLLEFDVRVSALITLLGGVYRRYSDDILVIVAPKYACAVKAFVHDEIVKHKITINMQKTTESRFFKCARGHVSLRQGDKPFQYLGFVFDGNQQVIRSQSLSRYWRKIKFASRRAQNKALRSKLKGRNPKVFKRAIFERFTHLGKRNFISYAKRAAKAIGGHNNWKQTAVWRQVKNHFPRIEKLLS